MRIEDKGPDAPSPAIPGPSGRVAAEIARWPGVIAPTHWHLYRPGQTDGADFYVGKEELGYVHIEQPNPGDFSPRSGTLSAQRPAEVRRLEALYADGWYNFTTQKMFGLAGSEALPVTRRSRGRMPIAMVGSTRGSNRSMTGGRVAASQFKLPSGQK